MKSQSSAGLDAGYCGGVATPGPGTVVPDAAFRTTKCFRPLSLHSMPLFHICIYHASCCHVCGLREIKICICILECTIDCGVLMCTDSLCFKLNLNMENLLHLHNPVILYTLVYIRVYGGVNYTELLSCLYIMIISLHSDV